MAASNHGEAAWPVCDACSMNRLGNGHSVRSSVAMGDDVVAERTANAQTQEAEEQAVEVKVDVEAKAEGEKLTGEEEAIARVSQRASFFSIAASLASQAGRVITLPRTKSRTLEETESEASPSSDPQEPEAEEEPQIRQSSGAGQPKNPADPPLLPWQARDEAGDIVEDTEVRRKILEVTLFRSTYIEHPGGEEEYVFDYARYKDIGKELLLCDPSLREMHGILIPSVVSEIDFWRHFFLRCNAVCLEMGRPPYLLEVKSTYSSSAAIASFQKFKRDLFLRRQRSTGLKLSFRLPINTVPLKPAADPGVEDLDVDLGDLDLDLDGEIDRELIRRRPSRAAEHFYMKGAVGAPGE